MLTSVFSHSPALSWRWLLYGRRNVILVCYLRCVKSGVLIFVILSNTLCMLISFSWSAFHQHGGGVGGGRGSPGFRWYYHAMGSEESFASRVRGQLLRLSALFLFPRSGTPSDKNAAASTPNSFYQTRTHAQKERRRGGQRQPKIIPEKWKCMLYNEPNGRFENEKLTMGKSVPEVDAANRWRVLG